MQSFPPADRSRYVGAFIPAHYHYQMLLDEARMTGFERALNEVVPEGGRVLDLGGGTGVLSYFAAQRAEQVYCVEYLPDLVHHAREFLAHNGAADRVDVIQAHADTYLPPEPVDVVVCEMLHSALLRERQTQIIASFKERYLDRFESLPVFVPEATLLGVQPVHMDFDFHGYHAPLAVFENPGDPLARISALGEVTPYAIVDYAAELPPVINFCGDLVTHAEGSCNALRFVTNNILAIQPEDQSTVDWMNQNLVLPLPEPVEVTAGGMMRVEFGYAPGDEIGVLGESLRAG